MNFKRIFHSALWAFVFILHITTSYAEQAQRPGAINFKQLLQAADFSNAAYQTKAEIQQLSKLHHYDLTGYGNIPELEVSYFLLTDNLNKSQVIVVRGTSNIENALVNANIQLTQDPYTKVRLHAGFLQTARKVYFVLKPLLKSDYAITTTGHSLGGAVALIIGIYLDVDHFRVQQVVTFGQPKVTNIAGAVKINHLNITRVVMPKDLVPLVPLLDPMDIHNMDVYWHAGKEVVLLQGKDYAVLEGMDSMLRATRFTQEELSEQNMEEHRMSSYLAKLQEKIPLARQVPFKNNLNLFNLFNSE